ncbi:MAG: methionyl-tRNA formyltransferase [Myxococcales bacterium]|nr:methionyl-tRNA formyltransferase [Myxococcales bacterium]|tara:strand:+ start:746 stop:1705 length:960 start_codon:yes stop_codon:yes gene_type:complete
MLRVIFMGTPDFAVPGLQVLVENHQVDCVFTQPDRPAGRGNRVVMSPVKQAALAAGITVEQPVSLRTPEGQNLIEAIRAQKPDLIVVAAYGQILPKELLDIPRLGCVNIHASLLPRWRGASPIQAAIGAGDETTGVTLMQMDEGLDTGPMIAQSAISIPEQMTAGELHDALADLGAELLSSVLASFVDGDTDALHGTPQPADGVTYAGKITKSDGWIDWNRPAADVINHIRAMNPWPGAQARLEGRAVRVVRAQIAKNASTSAPAGTLYALNGEAGLVTTSDGILSIEMIHPAGKKPMSIARYLDGQRMTPPCSFATEP